MEELYQTYKDLAGVYIVYISEAHASDDPRPVPYAKKLGIKEHTTFGERCTVASRLVADKKLTIPCLVDGLEGVAETAYQGWPDRVYLINKAGQLAIAGNRGPWGFAPGIEAAEKWLAEYKKTGKEPPPVTLADDQAKRGELSMALGRAYEAGEYQKALEVAQKLHHLFPNDVGTMYNAACMHCLVGHHDEAYSWLEKAIEAGYDDADHLSRDGDFKAIRDQPRFQKLIDRARSQQRAEAG
ncbi:MAG: hypothetical protein IID40_10860 [Planctomycetes bacterium]|nr:hypothetical protein [Planctomycetota bacterium]